MIMIDLDVVFLLHFPLLLLGERVNTSFNFPVYWAIHLLVTILGPPDNVIVAVPNRL